MPPPQTKYKKKELVISILFVLSFWPWLRNIHSEGKFALGNKVIQTIQYKFKSQTCFNNKQHRDLVKKECLSHDLGYSTPTLIKIDK